MLFYCPRCKHIFSGATFINTVASFSNNVMRCPYCKFPGGQSLNGTFSFDAEGAATLISGPEFTQEVLRQLEIFAIQAEKEKYSPEKVKTEIKKIHPNLSDFIPQTFGDVMAFLAFLVSVLTYLNESKNVTVNNTKNNYYQLPRADTSGLPTHQTPKSKSIDELKSKDSSFLANKKGRKKKKL